MEEPSDEAEILGIPGTGNTSAYETIEIFRYEGGEVVELWTVHDRIHVYGQYGLISLADEMHALPEEFEEEGSLSLEVDDRNVEQNIEVVTTFFNEAWNNQQFDLLEELIDFDSYMHADYPTAAAPYLHEDMRADWELAFEVVPDVS